VLEKCQTQKRKPEACDWQDWTIGRPMARIEALITQQVKVDDSETAVS